MDSLTPQPTCSNDTLTFNCQVNLGSFYIKWNHTAFEIEFVGGVTVVGNTTTASDGQVVANLTRRKISGTGRYLLSSTLIIHPPLNSLNLNDTNVVCERSEFRSDDAPISLYGEQLNMYLIMQN